MLWEDAIKLRLPVFPCLTNKRPACQHGFKDAQVYPQAIQELFSACPDATLIGVPTGARSGFDVLDIDSTRHPESKKWLDLASLPATRVHLTRSGGYHYLFQHNSNVKNWSARPVLGVDGRGEGGYIIWWPQTGCGATTDVDIVPWPSRILNECNPKKTTLPKSADRVTPLNNAKFDGVVNRILASANGERNNVLFWGTCRFAEWIEKGELHISVGSKILKLAGDKIGLDPDEIEKTIMSGLTRGGERGNTAE